MSRADDLEVVTETLEILARSVVALRDVERGTIYESLLGTIDEAVQLMVSEGIIRAGTVKPT